VDQFQNSNGDDEWKAVNDIKIDMKVEKDKVMNVLFNVVFWLLCFGAGIVVGMFVGNILN